MFSAQAPADVNRITNRSRCHSRFLHTLHNNESPVFVQDCRVPLDGHNIIINVLLHHRDPVDPGDIGTYRMESSIADGKGAQRVKDMGVIPNPHLDSLIRCWVARNRNQCYFAVCYQL